METAPKFLRPLLGYYEIDDYYDQINPEYLRAKAKPLNVVNTLLIHSIPVKGIYTYTVSYTHLTLPTILLV